MTRPLHCLALASMHHSVKKKINDASSYAIYTLTLPFLEDTREKRKYHRKLVIYIHASEMNQYNLFRTLISSY